MDEVMEAGKFRSLMAWGKRCIPKMAPSTIHAIHESGRTSPDNVALLARAAGVNPKQVWIRIRWWDEELPPDNPELAKVAEALATLPEDLRPLAADLAVGTIERLRQPEAQQAIPPYLRPLTRQEDEP